MSHPLSPEALSRIAVGDVTPEILRWLRATQFNKHQVLLEAVRRRAEQGRPAGRVDALDQAVKLLADLQERDPDAMAGVLSLPQVGSWAVGSLERMRRGEAPDLDYLQSLAASAAVRAGWPCELPMRGETAFLPGLGTLAAGRWEPIPRLRARSAGLTLKVSLDVADPYLAEYGRRSAPDPGRWQRDLDEAWRILTHRHRAAAEALSALLTTLVPLAEPPSGPPLSATSGWAHGAIALSPPPDPLSFAEILVHEIRHVILGAVEDLVRLVSDDDERLWYAPWRDDPRPLRALLQGCYAFLAITEFWLTEYQTGPAATRGRAEMEFAHWRRATFEAARTAAAAESLTLPGRIFAAGIRDRVGSWLALEVSPRVERYANGLREEHRARWRRVNRAETF